MFALMVAVAMHAQATRRSDHPSSRKRIRLANASLILLILPMLATGVSLLDPERRPREWALLWMWLMCLVALSVGLAVLDAINTLRLLRHARRGLTAALESSRGLAATETPHEP